MIADIAQKRGFFILPADGLAAIADDIQHIRHHSTCRRKASGTSAAEQHILHNVADHQNAVVHIVHAGKRVVFRHKVRCCQGIDLAVFGAGSASDKLHRIAAFFGIGDVVIGDVRDALAEDSLRAHVFAIRKRG